MNRLATALSATVLIVAAMPFVASATDSSASSQPDPSAEPAVRFGMDAASVAAQRDAGVPADYGTVWIGPWTLGSGWGGPDAQLDRLRAAGVTPAIHLYYWGDDISQSCLEDGCWSSLHKVRKDRERWSVLSQQLIDHLDARMGGKPVVIFLETEFNKGDVGTYEPLDGHLAAKADGLKRGYPAAQVVLALGNWNSASWGTWDRAAAASDFVGLQGMRASTRDSASSYDGLYSSTLSGARKAQSLFGKPVFLHDIALSSYPSDSYESRQATALAKFFAGMADLRAAGVQALLYRSWHDTPTMDTANYYGVAERHWGLATSTEAKPAAKAWTDGVKAERARATEPAFKAAFTPKWQGNDWWVEAAVKASAEPAKVEARVDGGAWTTLPRTDWDTWGRSLHAPDGATVVFRATAPSGATKTSQAFAWD